MCHDAIVVVAVVAVAVVVGVDNGKGVWWDDKNKERGFKSKLFIRDKKLDDSWSSSPSRSWSRKTVILIGNTSTVLNRNLNDNIASAVTMQTIGT